MSTGEEERPAVALARVVCDRLKLDGIPIDAIERQRPAITELLDNELKKIDTKHRRAVKAIFFNLAHLMLKTAKEASPTPCAFMVKEYDPNARALDAAARVAASRGANPGEKGG